MARIRAETLSHPRRPRTASCLRAVLAAATLAMSGCAISPFSHHADDTAKTRSAQQAIDDTKPPMQRGDDAVTRGDFAAATRAYKSAHESDPKSLEPLRRLGSAELALSDYAEAYETYHELQEIAPNDADAAFRMGELMLIHGSPQAAIDQFNIALATRNNDPQLYSVIGVAYSMMGRYDLAIRSYQDGLKLMPDHQGLRNNLGLAQFLAGDSTDAIKTFSDLVAMPNAKPRYRQNLALIYAMNGDMDKAREVAGSDTDLAALDSDVKYFRALQNPDAGTVADNRALMGVHMSSDAAAQSLAMTVAAGRKQEIAA
ncbi:MAG TPA: tetratricopeptide repeat protein, partial [Stellaceae bacterium]|nr:tetratricopeptide repeat protein [Stellaceae bacterium]